MNNEDILDYCQSLWHEVPSFVYLAVVLAICFGYGILVIIQGRSRGLKSSIWLVLGG